MALSLGLLTVGILATVPFLLIVPELALIPVGLLAMLAFVALQMLVQRAVATVFGWIITWAGSAVSRVSRRRAAGSCRNRAA